MYHDILLQRLRISYGLAAVLSTGSSHTWAAASETSVYQQRVHHHPQSSLVYHKEVSLELSSLACMPLTCCSWSNVISLLRTLMQMTFEYTASVGLGMSTASPTGKESICIDEVSAWMMANRLQLNHSKTEVIWFSSARRLQHIPTGPVRIGGASVLPVHSVRDLGGHLDADVGMKAHISATMRSCFTALRQIRSVRRSLPRYALQTLIRALVVSKVGYCNAVLASVSEGLLDRLQLVMNAAARLVFSARKHDHITPLPMISTGWGSRSELISGYVSSCATVYTEERYHISPKAFTVQLITMLDVVFVQQKLRRCSYRQVAGRP